MVGLGRMITSDPDEIVLRPNARRLAKNLAREPQGEIESALVMQMAFTHRSENILTE